MEVVYAVVVGVIVDELVFLATLELDVSSQVSSSSLAVAELVPREEALPVVVDERMDELPDPERLPVAEADADAP